ncbi:MAG: CRISPR-associated endonuclease Cas1 [Deltaproteobacteria bacterium]|nr:CRISPR-associated endonuclease Cas1 [Deltaproteobacteria bacterium]
MKTAYITEQGATLRRDGPVLQVWTGKKRITELLVHDLDQLVLMGNIMITPAVLDFLIAERVDTVFMSIHGRFRGRLMHEHSKNVRLRLAQYQQLQTPGVALALAQRLVRGKILNTRAFVLKAARRMGGDSELAEAAARLLAMAERLAEMKTLEQVRGCEGRASAVYFGIFGRLLKHPDFTFTDRNRRPPLDPVNVLLSLGYTLLANAVETAIQIVGLDPYLGALHEIAYGRPSLVCDLMEEYRSVIVEPMVVACINQRSFAAGDFESAGEGEPVRFKRAALKWFVELFERRLRGTILYPPRGQRLTYRQVIEEQVRRCARVLLGTEAVYEPFLIR